MRNSQCIGNSPAPSLLSLDLWNITKWLDGTDTELAGTSQAATRSFLSGPTGLDYSVRSCHLTELTSV